MELTGLEIANSSLLDEASAVAEAAVMMHRANRKVKNGFFAVDSRCLPQVISVTRGRAEMLGIPFVVTDFSEGLPEGACTVSSWRTPAMKAIFAILSR